MLRWLRIPKVLQAAPAPAGQLHAGLQILLLILAPVLIYVNTFQSPFILDDHANIVENRAVRLVEFTFENLARAVSENPIKTRPVAYLSFALNHFVHGYDLTGYHLVNLVVHILNGIFLYLLIKTTIKILEEPTGDDRPTGAVQVVRWLPCVAALIWLVHPLHTQSVTYIVQRMNSLAALFYITAIWFYARARIARKPISRNLFFSGTFLAGGLALGSKEIALMLPVTLFLYEWFFLQNLDFSWLRKKVPIIIGLLLLIVLVAFVFVGSNPLEYIRDSYKWRNFTMTQRVFTELRVVAHYLGLLIWPHPSRLNFDYDFALSQSLVDPATTLLALITITGMIIGAAVAAPKYRGFSFCILCFFSNLLIESSFLGLEIIFEHRTYLPSMFAVTALTLIFFKFLSAGVVRALVIGVLVIFFSIWTYERNTVWRNEVVFFTDCLEKSPDKWRVHANLGSALVGQGRFDEALFHFNKALLLNSFYDPEVNPAGTEKKPMVELTPLTRRRYADMLSNMGNALVRKGDPGGALTRLHQALALDPQHVRAHVNMGLALSGQGNSKAAITYYQGALQLDPEFAEAHNNLGLELAAQGHTDAALNSFNRAIALNPRFVEAYNNKGIQLARQGNNTAALSNFSRAVTLDPDYAEAHYNMGNALFSIGKVKLAKASFQRALSLKPDFGPARDAFLALAAREQQQKAALKRLQADIAQNPDNHELYGELGDLHKESGDLAGALVHYEKAAKIKPDHIPAMHRLGIACAITGDYDRAVMLFKQIAARQPQNGKIFYQIAAIYARRQDTGNAIIWLEKAIKRGYSDWSAIQADKNMAGIRHTDAFANLKKKYNI